MTDAMERAVQKIALKRNGESKTVDDCFDIIVALADDTDSQHVDSTEAIVALTDQVQALDGKLADHILVYAAERDRRLDSLEKAALEAHSTCPDAVRAAIIAEHGARHREHMKMDHAPRRSEDAVGEDHTDDRRAMLEDASTTFKVRLMWGGLAVGGIALANAIAYWLVPLVFHIHH